MTDDIRLRALAVKLALAMQPAPGKLVEEAEAILAFLKGSPEESVDQSRIGQIWGLHSQGLKSVAIASRLGLKPGTVYSALSSERRRRGIPPIKNAGHTFGRQAH